MPELKRCPNCGGSAFVDAPVCMVCGHQYRTQFAPPNNNADATRRKKQSRLLVVIALLSVAITAVIFSHINASDKPQHSTTYVSATEKEREVRDVVAYTDFLASFNLNMKDAEMQWEAEFKAYGPANRNVAGNEAAQFRQAFAQFQRHESPDDASRLKSAYAKYLRDYAQFMENVSNGDTDMLSSQREDDEREVYAAISELKEAYPDTAGDLDGFTMW